MPGGKKVGKNKAVICTESRAEVSDATECIRKSREGYNENDSLFRVV